MATDLSVSYRCPATAQRMAGATSRFLESLSSQQRAAATFPFEGDERYKWHYTPIDRNGLRLISMTRAQQQAALALFDAGLSARGASQARQIIDLEPILRETERVEHVVNRWVRDPELYYFSIFGEPGGAAPWAWRAGGHHLGLHFTVVDRELIAPTPLFFGANPAEVRHGPEAGKRTLPEEEDMARALLRGMDASQKSTAVINPIAPDDIVTEAHRTADPNELPVGLAYAAMSGEQRGQLIRLMRHYVERAADEVASTEWARIEQAGLEQVTFAWAGPEEPGQGHYYAIRGPRFMIEYDNTQNHANHIHAVWRDYTNDWGEDLLAAHYARSHRS
jgi:hypothetical protein